MLITSTLPRVWRDIRRLTQPWQIMDPKMDSGFVEPTDTFEPEWKVIDEDGISGEEVSVSVDLLVHCNIMV